MFVLGRFKIEKLTVLKSNCRFMYHAIIIKVKRAPPLLKATARVGKARQERVSARGGPRPAGARKRAPAPTPPVYPGAVAKLGKRGLARRWGTLKG